MNQEPDQIYQMNETELRDELRLMIAEVDRLKRELAEAKQLIETMCSCDGCQQQQKAELWDKAQELAPSYKYGRKLIEAAVKAAGKEKV